VLIGRLPVIFRGAKDTHPTEGFAGLVHMLLVVSGILRDGGGQNLVTFVEEVALQVPQFLAQLTLDGFFHRALAEPLELVLKILVNLQKGSGHFNLGSHGSERQNY